MKVYSDHKPEILEPVGNGSYLYHYDITEETQEFPGMDPGEAPITRKVWTASEVLVWGPVTGNSLTKAVITEKWSSDHEQKLVNDKNSAELGIISGQEAEEALARYKEFLTTRAKLKRMVDADCKTLGLE